MSAVGLGTLDFALPAALVAGEPPEARGLARDEVRLMVSSLADGSVVHTRFPRLPELLRPGDVLVVNTSGTIAAALAGRRQDGERVVLHLSQRLPTGRWSVELRRPVDGAVDGATVPLLDARPGERVELAAGGSATLLAAYDAGSPARVSPGTRLWVAALALPGELTHYLDEHGSPIRYGYVRERWPLSAYQTMFASEPGSAEMPSAGRAFTPRVVERLERRGIVIAPVLLHTGVASLETHEPPFPERFRVGEETARIVSEAKRRGGRIVAVGTTSTRAIETMAERDGTVGPGEGWTDLVITPERGLRAVDALLTGFHEPRASHLAMLEALAGRERLAEAYDAAIAEGYLWHEFGDLHLILNE